MNHSFNIELAKEIGVNEAIMLENLYFWISKNKANNKHYYEGKYWTYNSIPAFTKLFPYWTISQIKTILKHLTEKEYIITGNYNKAGYDRTKWYTLTEKSLKYYEPLKILISQNSPMDKSNFADGKAKIDRPIPDINTDIKHIKESKKASKPNSFNDIVDSYTDDEELKTVIFEFIKMRMLIKKPMTDYALKRLLKKLDRFSNNIKADKIEILNRSIENSWQDIYQLKTNNINSDSKYKVNVENKANIQAYKPFEFD